MYLYQLKEEIERLEKLRGGMARTNIIEVIVEPDFWGIEFVNAEVDELEDEIRYLKQDLRDSEIDADNLRGEIRDLERKLDARGLEIQDLESEIEDLRITIEAYNDND